MSAPIMNLKWVLLIPINLIVRSLLLQNLSSAVTLTAYSLALLQLFFVGLFVVSKIDASLRDWCGKTSLQVVALVPRNCRTFRSWSFVLFVVALGLSLLCPTQLFIYCYPYLVTLSIFPYFSHHHRYRGSDDEERDTAPNTPPWTLDHTTHHHDLRWGLLILAILYCKPYVFTFLLFLDNDGATTASSVVVPLFIAMGLVLVISCFFSVKLYLTDYDPFHGLVAHVIISYQRGYSLLIASIFVLSFLFPLPPIFIFCFVPQIVSFWPDIIQNCLRRNICRAYASVTTFLTFHGPNYPARLPAPSALRLHPQPIHEPNPSSSLDNVVVIVTTT